MGMGRIMDCQWPESEGKSWQRLRVGGISHWGAWVALLEGAVFTLTYKHLVGRIL